MKRRRKTIYRTIIAGCVMSCILIGAGCGRNNTSQQENQSQKLASLGKVVVITREEGSGTRQAFAEMIGLSGKNTKKANKDKITSKADMTSDAQGVLERVRKDKGSIGFVSQGSLKGKKQGIKVLKIDGVSLTRKHIQDGSYSLTRKFNLTFGGVLSSLENDFLNYVLSRGQKIVGQEYSPVKKSKSFMSFVPKGTITINGSTSMVPLLQELAKDYQKGNKQAKVVVTATDSEKGLLKSTQNLCNFGMVSRDLQYFEKELVNYRTIAKDGIAIVVNQKNPLKTLDETQLKRLYSGKTNQWNKI